MRMGCSAIMPSTYLAKGGADIFSCMRRRVGNKSMMRREKRMGERNSEDTLVKYRGINIT